MRLFRAALIAVSIVSVACCLIYGEVRRPWHSVQDGFVRYDLPADREVFIVITDDEDRATDYRSLFISESPGAKVSQWFVYWRFFGMARWNIPRSTPLRDDETAGWLMPAPLFVKLAGERAWEPIPEDYPTTDWREAKRVAARLKEFRGE